MILIYLPKQAEYAFHLFLLEICQTNRYAVNYDFFCSQKNRTHTRRLQELTQGIRIIHQNVKYCNFK